MITHTQRQLRPHTPNPATETDQGFWPINEILLAVQVKAGKSDLEIAAAYGVGWQEVQSLRANYGL